MKQVKFAASQLEGDAALHGAAYSPCERPDAGTVRKLDQ